MLVMLISSVKLNICVCVKHAIVYLIHSSRHAIWWTIQDYFQNTFPLNAYIIICKL